MKIIQILVFAVLMLTACKNETSEKNEPDANMEAFNQVEVQGHRGDRGNFPENSLPAFINAVKKGADVLELDVVISKDKKVVVSHEPYMHNLYMLTPEGDSISEERQKSYNFYEMEYDSIRAFDAGSKGNKLFPDQKKQKTYKPLLSEVVDSVENYIAEKELEAVKYNIEIKSSENNYEKYQPKPEVVVDLVMEVMEEYEVPFNLQSFDVNILNIANEKYPEVELGYLVSNEGIEKNLEKLDFHPDNYNPNFKLVKNKAFVDSVKNKEMKLIPWTVNRKSDIKRMVELEVDGIITDFPERVIKAL